MGLYSHPGSCLTGGNPALESVGSMVRLMAHAKRGPSQPAAASAFVPVGCPCWPMPPQETLQHHHVVVVQSPVGSLLLSSGSWCMQDFVCVLQGWSFCFPQSLQDWSLCFPQSCGSPVIKSQWFSRPDSLGVPSPFVRFPGWEAWCAVQNPYNSSLVLLFLRFVGHPPGGYQSWFYHDCIPPTISLWLLLCLCCGWSFLAGLQYLLVNSCSITRYSFSALTGENEHMSFDSAILIRKPREGHF